MNLKFQNQIAKTLIIIGIVIMTLGIWNDSWLYFFVSGGIMIVVGLSIIPSDKKIEEKEVEDEEV